MTNSEQDIIKTALSHHRLEALSDAVLAIVMTLLVLGLTIPVFTGNLMHSQLSQLAEMWPEFASYVATFLLLGFMWSVHHFGFSYIKRSDSVSTWLNIICLMFVALLPFSTSLLAENWGQQLPVLIYEGNGFMCLFPFTVLWLYATGKYRLVDPNIDPQEVRMGKIMQLTSLAVFAIAMGVSYLNTIASICIYVADFLFGIIITVFRYRIRITEQVAK